MLTVRERPRNPIFRRQHRVENEHSFADVGVTRRRSAVFSRRRAGRFRFRMSGAGAVSAAGAQPGLSGTGRRAGVLRAAGRADQRLHRASRAVRRQPAGSIRPRDRRADGATRARRVRVGRARGRSDRRAVLDARLLVLEARRAPLADDLRPDRARPSRVELGHDGRSGDTGMLGLAVI